MNTGGTEQRVISADNHLIDPKDLYVERLPKEFRDRAPRVMRGPDGGDGWSFDGRPPARTFGLEAVAGRPDQHGAYKPTGMTWEEILPGNYDGTAHLADMDRDGIDGAVVYPTVAMAAYSIPDPTLRLALLQTYNDWLLDDFESTDRSRLVGLCALPVDDPVEVAISEVQRCAAKGARAYFVPGSPERGYWDPAYDPLWRGGLRDRLRRLVPPEPRREAPGRRGRPTRRAGYERRRHRGSLLLGRHAVDVHDLHRCVRAVPRPEGGRGRGQLRLDAVLAREHGPELRPATALGTTPVRAPAQHVRRPERVRDDARRPRGLRGDAPGTAGSRTR